MPGCGAEEESQGEERSGEVGIVMLLIIFLQKNKSHLFLVPRYLCFLMKIGHGINQGFFQVEKKPNWPHGESTKVAF